MKQFWYVAPKEGQKYASVGCSGWNEANSVLVFDELAFCKDDDFYHVFAHATEFKEIQNFNDKNWKFEPQLVKLRVARKDYQKEDKDKNKVDVKQSRLEKWLCSVFDESEEGLIYKGWINLKDDPYCDLFVSKLDLKGQPISDAVLTQMMSMSLEWELLQEPPKFIDPENDIKLPTGKAGSYGKGGYVKGQTEGEKLNDRIAFVFGQINVLELETPVTSLVQVSELMNDSKIGKTVKQVFELAVALMS